MRLMGLQAIYRAPRTSEPHPEHRVYPYLLKGWAIERANHVGCADITYIPVRRGFLYLVAILDSASRYVRAWRLSNTLDAGFCVEALEEARTRHGQPEIFNTDQGSPFTGFAFTGRLRAAGVQISMDGRGRCMDNIFIERLWRSLKYEAVYLHDLADGFQARRVIGEWIDFYNAERPHSALGGKTPAEAYRGDPPVDMMDKPLRAFRGFACIGRRCFRPGPGGDTAPPSSTACDRPSGCDSPFGLGPLRSCFGSRPNGVLEWGDDDPCADFRECFIDGPLVVCSVTGEAHDLLVVWDLIEEVRNDACVIGRAAGQFLGHDHTVLINANMKFPPLPRSPLAVFGSCPRAFTDDL